MINLDLTLSWRRSLLYRNQSIDLQRKSMDWFLYDRDVRHENVKVTLIIFFWFTEFFMVMGSKERKKKKEDLSSISLLFLLTEKKYIQATMSWQTNK